MRLPFPTRISVQKTLIFTLIVLVAQQIEHTEFAFSILFCGYIIISVLAFNYAGGFSRAPGTYIFWFSLLTCVLGGIWKIVLGEPGDSNLITPALTVSTYVVSVGVMIVALFITKRLVGEPRGLGVTMRA